MKLLYKKRSYPDFSLKEYVEKRNRILFVRQVGGLGDIIAHCMMFEDIKKMSPDIKIVWAVPKEYICVARMHKYVDEVINVGSSNPNDFVIYYNTTTACRDHELKMAPYSCKNRSDIWANHCGVELTNHNINLNLPEVYINEAREYLKQKNPDNYPIVLLSPISSIPGKDLTTEHLQIIADFKKRGLFIFATHTIQIPALEKLGIHVIYGQSIPVWMGLIQAADYVISVDTAAFHYAGAIGKPTLGIFTFADGKVYGKYYPKFVLVQKHRDDGNWNCGPCYNWMSCPKSDHPSIKPCLTEITPKMLTCGVNTMLEKYPVDTILK